MEQLLLGMRVLVVEDMLVNQKMLSLQLNRLGCEVLTAVNGSEAVASIQTMKFDLIFMDIEMPIMNGIAATTSIRQLEAADRKRTPIIALTGYKKESDKQRCAAAGMDGYLSKGANCQEILDAINKLSTGPV